MRFRMQPVPDPRCLCFQRRARNAHAAEQTGESRVRKDHFGIKENRESQGDWKLNGKLVRVIFCGAEMDKEKSSR